MVNIQLERDEKVGGRWRVVRKLAEGGFGAVYLAIDEKSKEECAVKVEPCDQNSVLKMEAHVLMQLRGKSMHACAFLGCGRQEGKMNYLVMTLVGRSLCDLHRSRPDRRFTSATTTRLAIQCIEALRELHNIGFVHRDVKPGNLAIGRLDADRRMVYILDFGLARCYNDPNTKSNVRPPRQSVGFRGTVRYASINVHEGLDQGRHDDLLSLMYVLIEFRSMRLPWNDVDDDEEVARIKKTTSSPLLLKDMDPEYTDVFLRLSRLEYKHNPDYEWMCSRFAELQKKKNYPIDGSFEWE